MSYSYTPCVSRQCLVTFQKNPRVLDEHEHAVRVIAAVAEVEAVGQETVSLLLLRVYPHRADIDADDITGQPYDDPDPPLELTLRSDAILAMSPIDDEDDEDDEEYAEEDEDDDDDDDDDDA